VIPELQKEDNSSDLLVDFWRARGSCLIRLNRKQEALTAFYESLKISEKTGSMQGSAAAITNIGWVYMEMFQFQKAIAEFYKAKSLVEDNPDKVSTYFLPMIYNNLASCYSEEGELDSSYLYTNKGIDAALVINDYETAANGLN